MTACVRRATSACGVKRGTKPLENTAQRALSHDAPARDVKKKEEKEEIGKRLMVTDKVVSLGPYLFSSPDTHLPRGRRPPRGKKK